MWSCNISIIILVYFNLLVAFNYGQESHNNNSSVLIIRRDMEEREPNSYFKFLKDRTTGGVTKRIIGGNVAIKHQFPYQVALFVYVGNQLYFCGGSLITKQWVLTAAHCVDNASYVIVVLGSHNLSVTESSRIVLNTSTFIIHQEWDEDTLQNDIALIRLPRVVTLNDYITTVNLAEGSDSYEDLLSTCLGWGVTVLGSTSNVLRYVDLNIISNTDCAGFSDYTPYIVDTHICTSGNGMVGSCNGDSGGPLMVNGEQVGIVSFGATNCQAGLPSVFTRVTEFRTWIAEALNGSYEDDFGENRGLTFKLNPILKHTFLLFIYLYHKYLYISK